MERTSGAEALSIGSLDAALEAPLFHACARIYVLFPQLPKVAPSRIRHVAACGWPSKRIQSLAT